MNVFEAAVILGVSKGLPTKTQDALGESWR